MTTAFEWDDAKATINREKHGLAFEDAPLVFKGQTVTRPDLRQHYGEPRFLTFGTLHGRVVVIAHTFRNDATRIISMRYANAREQARFRQA